MELRPKLTPVVGLDTLDIEGKLSQDVVYESDRGLLGVALVDPEDSDPRAVIDSRVLVIGTPLREWLEELDVDLELMTRQRLFTAAEALFPPAVAHARG